MAEQILNDELVARVIFPPQMILDGMVMPAASTMSISSRMQGFLSI